MVTKEMSEYLKRNCVGVTCEVLTERNPLLIIGKFAGYKPDGSMMQVNVVGRGSVPQGLIFHSPVWVRARMERNRILMLSGRIERIAPDFYLIGVLEAVCEEERRGYFRQRVTGTATVSSADNDVVSACELVDVSKNGIAFMSKTEYTRGDRIILSDVWIAKGTEPYTFHCSICRISENKGWFIYGCRLLELDEHDENRLMRDIFKLQAEEIAKAKKPR